jgi:hypothetical protein
MRVHPPTHPCTCLGVTVDTNVCGCKHECMHASMSATARAHVDTRCVCAGVMRMLVLGQVLSRAIKCNLVRSSAIKSVCALA